MAASFPGWGDLCQDVDLRIRGGKLRHQVCGNSWGHKLVNNLESLGCSLPNVLFESGLRSDELDGRADKDLAKTCNLDVTAATESSVRGRRGKRAAWKDYNDRNNVVMTAKMKEGRLIWNLGPEATLDITTRADALLEMRLACHVGAWCVEVPPSLSSMAETSGLQEEVFRRSEESFGRVTGTSIATLAAPGVVPSLPMVGGRTPTAAPPVVGGRTPTAAEPSVGGRTQRRRQNPTSAAVDGRGDLGWLRLVSRCAAQPSAPGFPTSHPIHCEAAAKFN